MINLFKYIKKIFIKSKYTEIKSLHEFNMVDSIDLEKYNEELNE